MTTEFHEDSDVRAFLGEAVRGQEPPFRGFADGAIARGDAARRRNRILGGAGATLSVAAVIGTFAVVTGATPPAAPRPQSATTAHPGDGTYNQAAAKQRDIQTRLPALLQQLLPNGITIGQVPANRAYMGSPNFMLTGPTGTTQIVVNLGKPLGGPERDRQTGCMQFGGCKVIPVSGGTVYVNDSSLTAKAQSVGYGADAFQPGTADKVVIQDVTMTFIPTDRTKTFSIRETTQVAQMPWADKAPKGYDPKWGPWPPKPAPDFTIAAEDASGILLSSDDFAALVAESGFAAVENLLDAKTPPSQQSIDQGVDVDKQLAALSAPVLPPGLKLQQDELSLRVPNIPSAGGQFDLVGPSGMNYFRWIANPWTQKFADDFTQVHECADFSGQCSVTAVPGGRLLIQRQNIVPAKVQLTTTVVYTFMPDDKNSPVVTVSLETAVKGVDHPIAGMTTDQLLTAEQFVALVKTPGIADVMVKASELVKQ